LAVQIPVGLQQQRQQQQQASWPGIRCVVAAAPRPLLLVQLRNRLPLPLAVAVAHPLQPCLLQDRTGLELPLLAH
jgi:hypothetical protein